MIDPNIEVLTLFCIRFNKVFENLFLYESLNTQSKVFTEKQDPSAKLYFIKEGIGVEVGSTNYSFKGMGLLRFRYSL